MINKDLTLLDKLTDDEIQLVCKKSDVEFFLRVFRNETDKNKYKKYTQKLGRLDKKTSLAKTLCPQYAYDLYKKGDTKIMSSVVTATEDLRDKFLNDISLATPNNGMDLLTDCSDEILVDLYVWFYNHWNNFTLELFYLLLKVNEAELDNERKNILGDKISKGIDKQNREEEISKKVEAETKKTEKKLLQQFSNEKEKILKDNRELRKNNEKLKNQNEDIRNELEELKRSVEREKSNLYQDLKLQIDKELKLYKKEQEEQINKDLKAKKQSVVEQISKEEKQKQQEIANRFDELQKNKEKEIREFDELLEELKNTLQNSKEEYDLIRKNIDDSILEQKQLEQAEIDYFRNVKKRFLQANLDQNLLQLAQRDGETESQAQSNCNTKMPIIHAVDGFLEETEASEEVTDLNDFIQDFSDNIARDFDNYSEIAAIIIAATSLNKPIVIEDGFACYIADSFSALIDAKPACVIDVNNSDLGVVTQSINNCENKVVVVKGVLRNYDEHLFDYICHECTKKYIFMTIADVNDFKMFSSSALHKALVLDVDSDYTFSSEDPIWIGKHDIERYVTPTNREDLRKKYDRYFRSLVSEKICNKADAVELSRIISNYMKVMSEIGEVISRSLRFYIDEDRIDAEDLKRLLEKNGWKMV